MPVRSRRIGYLIGKFEMTLFIEQLTDLSPEERVVEIVERKGLGHPDTLCDHISEEFSVALSRYYLKHFGCVLHHNVDKVLLSAGQSEATFGAGRLLKPFELYLSGRATNKVQKHIVPIAEIAQETVTKWFKKKLHAFDPKHSLRLHTITHPGSPELVSLFMRQQQTGQYLSNDTSCGVGFAPFTELELLVLAVEHKLNSHEFKTQHPETGEDIKVMGLRIKDEITLTIACAFISTFLESLKAYSKAKELVAETARRVCQSLTQREVLVSVNTGDDLQKGDVYMTVSGTSAEAGDDGETGRGNRITGLITPMRPMCLEAVAGKNPITHVGKLYSAAAQTLAQSLVQEIPGITTAECYLVSQIGRPIEEPNCAHLRIRSSEKVLSITLEENIQKIAEREIAKIPTLWKAFLAQEISVV